MLAADYEDDETLKAMTDEAMRPGAAAPRTCKEGLTAFIEKRPPQWKGR